MLRYVRTAFYAMLLLGAAPLHAETLETETLDGGVPLWVAPEPTLPLVTIRFTFQGAGSVSDSEGTLGRATLVSSLLGEGGGDLDAVAFQQALAAEAIQFSAVADSDSLHVTLVSLRQSLPQAIVLATKALAAPRFDAADVARLKGAQVARLKRAAEQPAYVASRLLSSHLFAGHPYASPTLGTAEDIAALNTSDLRDYVATYLTRGTLMMAASGDISAAELEDALAPFIQALPENIAGMSPVSPVVLPKETKVLRQQAEVPQSVILFALPWVARTDERFYASYLAANILGENPLGSRLGDVLRREGGKVYDVRSDIEIRRGASVLMGSAATRNDQVEETIAAIRQTFADFAARGATSEECADAKSYVIGRFPMQFDSTADRAATLQMMQFYQLPEDYLEKRSEIFDAVRCEEINRIAAQFLNPKHLIFAVVGGTPGVSER